MTDRNIEAKRIITTFRKIVAWKNGFHRLNSSSWALQRNKKRILCINVRIITSDLLKHGHTQVLTSDFKFQNKD